MTDFMFKTERWSTKIEKVAVTRTTESRVYYTRTIRSTSGNREEERWENKITDYHTYHASWTLAREHLADRESRKISYLKQNIEHHEKELQKIAAMVPPKENTGG